MPSVLFVCRANQFRSPLAAAFLRKITSEEYPGEEWVIGSAGTWVEEGLPAPPITLEAARKHQLDGLKQHFTRQVNPRLLDAADLVVVMEAGQKEALRYEFAPTKGKLYQLSEILDGYSYDIPDPGLGKIEPQEAADTLLRVVNQGSRAILDLARRHYQVRSTKDDKS